MSNIVYLTTMDPNIWGLPSIQLISWVYTKYRQCIHCFSTEYIVVCPLVPSQNHQSILNNMLIFCSFVPQSNLVHLQVLLFVAQWSWLQKSVSQSDLQKCGHHWVSMFQPAQRTAVCKWFVQGVATSKDCQRIVLGAAEPLSIAHHQTTCRVGLCALIESQTMLVLQLIIC